MAEIDLAVLREKAHLVLDGVYGLEDGAEPGWYTIDDWPNDMSQTEDIEFIAACSPTVILGIVASLERATSALQLIGALTIGSQDTAAHLRAMTRLGELAVAGLATEAENPPTPKSVSS